MAASPDRISFYFFDFDDNIMFLDTPIFIRNTVTKEEKQVSTGKYVGIRHYLGQPGEWEDYDEFDGSFRRFSDIPENELEHGQKQYFVQDVEKAIKSSEQCWQAPSWNLFVHACRNRRPISIITARSHSPETLKAGIRVLVKKSLIPQEPNYHTIFPVGNKDVRRSKLGDCDLQMTIPALKKRAIIKSVEEALRQYGTDPEHSFGMSDDDPDNVKLIISAMLECRKSYNNKRFFVIDTHRGEEVKLEVFCQTDRVIDPLRDE